MSERNIDDVRVDRIDARTFHVTIDGIEQVVRMPADLTTAQIDNILRIEVEHHLSQLRVHSLKRAAMLQASILEEMLRQRQPKASPPFMAETVLALLSPKRTVDAQIGDMQEMFIKNVERFGLNRARRLYWYEVFRSVWPALKRIGKKIGIFGFVVDYIRAKFGL